MAELVLQGSRLEALPIELLEHIVHYLSFKQRIGLRHVSCYLADQLKDEITAIAVQPYLPQAAAHRIAERLPSLKSIKLSCWRWNSIQPLTILQQLTMVCIGFRPMDMEPLKHLPKLHTLQLEHVKIQQLSRSHSCAMAGLTQVQALHLLNCSCDDTAAKGSKGGKPQDLAALPGVRQLRVIKCLRAIHGLQNLHQVEHSQRARLQGLK